MKIVLTWIPAGATQPTSFTLADSPANIPLTNYRENTSPNIQPVQFFRNAAQQYYDRGNLKTEVSFDTTRSFADQSTAEAYALMHGATLPNIATVTFTTGTGSGTSSTRYLVNASIQAVQVEAPTRTVKFSYRLMGGEMSTSNS